jgi:putative phosphoesterase
MALSIAVIADVHGNAWALEAVLADIRRRKIKRIVNLGDSVFGSGDAGRCANLLIKHCEVSVRGNCDRFISSPNRMLQHNADVVRIRRELNTHQMAWLAACPFDAVVAEFVYCCHATPQRDDAYLLEQVTPNSVQLAAFKSIQAKTRHIQQPVICIGHSHKPHVVQLPNGQLVINPGSVGMPAYDHTTPYPHVMETGSPHARYAILHQHSTGWRVEHCAIVYDWDTAANYARQLNRPDRAYWVETGRAKLPAA